ncbi:DUF6615 family protein [Funiculus sociatus]|uniref:DUF6615 family protein n=1 Tax=Funiculus sociatus TaxID=450527 RepID=UPI00329740F0
MTILAVQIFEELAKATWERIQFGEELGCRQGEETITDINILELKRARLCEVLIPEIYKATESKTGIDWEWWIGSDQRGWWRYAVQAKKVNSDQKYSKLRHIIGKLHPKKFQIDILESYAQGNNCIPLYCLYNFIDDNNLQKYWHCNFNYDKFQFGCTVVPVDVIRKAFKLGEKKTFQFVHSHESVLPWRCLVICPLILSARHGELHPLANGIYANFNSYDTLPSFLRQEAREGNRIELSNDFYNRQIEIYPKRILVIDVDNEA